MGLAAGPCDIGVTAKALAALAAAAVGGSAWGMAPRYALARLHGGPLDGDLVQAPLNQWRMPVDVIGLPVPVLDEQTEMFCWDTANYFSASLPPRWHQATRGRSRTPAPCPGTRPTPTTSHDPH